LRKSPRLSHRSSCMVSFILQNADNLLQNGSQSHSSLYGVAQNVS